MKRWTSTTLILSAICAAWFLACRTGITLLAKRAVMNMPSAVTLKNAPPLVAFVTVALGGFRGLLVDILWLRATLLQEEGRFFELNQLAEWVTKLDPHLTTIWSFHAWNMAYNISYMFSAPEDRWRWIWNAVRLLRDDGLKYSGDNPEIYRELGWIFLHKIGQHYDTANFYYKFRLAEEVTSAIGGGTPPQDSTAAAEALWEKFRMSAAIMRRIDQEFGPVDWRLPESHALYWGFVGREKSRSTADAYGCDRMICQALTAAFLRGRLEFDLEAGIYAASPNLEILPRVRAAFEQASARHSATAFSQLYANFLGEAVLALYAYDRIEEARSIFEDLQRVYPDSPDAHQDFESYVGKLFMKAARETRMRNTPALIEALFFNAYSRAAAGEERHANRYSVLAELLWQEYMKTISTPYLKESASLPAISEFRARAFERAMREVIIPERRARLMALREQESNQSNAQTSLSGPPAAASQ